MTVATRLTQTHRTTQERLGDLLAVKIAAAFDILDPEDLDGTFDDWVAAVEPIVQAGRAASSQLAAAYLAALRTLHLGDQFAAVLAGPLVLEGLRASMLVTGPISIRANLGRGTPLEQALETAQRFSAGAASRHAINAGRETITGTIQADPRAVGYERVTSGSGCDFCELLAARGAVYGAESADFEAHDRCGCTAEPVYR